MNYIQNNVVNNNNIYKLVREHRYFSKAKLYDQIFYQLVMWF
jgi:hypothetical protein